TVTSDSVDGVTVPRASYPLFTIDDARGVARAIPDERVVLTVQGTATFVAKAGAATRAATVVGMFGVPDAAGIPALLHGRFPTLEEMASDGAVVVVSNALAKELAGSDALPAVVGGELRLSDRPRTIVGVLDTF